MKSDPLLSKAARLAKKRDYEGALKVLKTEEDRYNGSFKYYYLYAVISLYAGGFVEALSYFRHAHQRKMNDTSTMLGLAVLYLKRMNTVQALDCYLDVREIEPKNKIAKKALAVIRKYSADDDLSDWMTPKRLAKLFPPIPSPTLSLKTVVIAALVLSAVLILTFVVLVKLRVLPSPIKGRDVRSTAEFVLSGQERSEPVETGSSYRYILTRDQVASQYDRALSLFSAYRDEAAKVHVNRILESNASESIKDKSRLLLTYMEVPGFDTFKQNDNPSFSEVKNEPVLYRDVYVIWRGMATNVEVAEEYTSFDFLVGYDTRSTLEGIVPVKFNIPVSISSERPLEVLGKIVPASSYTDFSLEGAAIHQSGRLEN
ncbi:MAG: tetratricopeptide repeat protein [Treponema sp.]|jgi:tetratricopeptide (TPR) repeat protein|nr:tetratricopeptide repeat protein [Treponema sp.]